MKFRIVAALAVSASALSLMPGEVAAQRTRAISQSSAASAAQQHPQIVAEFGGEESGTRSTYVRTVGARVAAHSNISGGGNAFRFTTLNSPVMNAFAVPGGYLYITRQLLALMNDEAELALVLGHEAGHIAARHSSERQRTNILSQLGALVLGAVTGSGQLAQIAAQGAQLYALRYSRSQEYESDELGIRYMTAAGYDPAAAPSMLASLGAWSDLEARFRGGSENQRAAPSWARTHPLSADRVRRATQRAQATGRMGQGIRNRDQHLGIVNGMLFDDDPDQGIVEGREFLHPNMRLAFTAPEGFGLQNGTRAVSVIGSSGQAQFSTLPFSGNLGTYIGQVYQSVAGQQTRVQYAQPRSTTVNGIPAAYTTARVQSQQGMMDVSVMAYQFDSNRAYHFVTITRAGTGFGPFTQMLQSVRRLTPQQAAAIRPRRIQVVTVGASDTVDSLARRMAYPNFQVERFRALNGLAANAAVQRNQRVKIVVYGTS